MCAWKCGDGRAAGSRAGGEGAVQDPTNMATWRATSTTKEFRIIYMPQQILLGVRSCSSFTWVLR